MPIKGAPISPGVEQGLAKEAAFFRTAGPSREIKPCPPKLNDAVKAELLPHLVNAQKAVASGGEVSAQALMGVKIMEKINSGQPLSSQELSIAWTIAQEARGEKVVDATGTAITDPKTGKDAIIGGIDDPDSIYYIKDDKERAKALKRLDKLQSDIELHLTGEEELRGLQDGELHFEIGTQLARGRAREVFRPRNDYPQVRDRLAQEMYSKDWTALSLDERKKVRPQALEEVASLQGTNMMAEFLGEVGGKFTDIELQTALASSNPREVALAKKAQNIEELRVKILREKSSIRKMKTMNELLTFMGYNPAVPNEANMINAGDVVEAVIARNNLDETKAAALRKNPNDALPYLNTNIADLGVFVGDLHRNKLQQYEMERNASVPEQLKKKKLELNDGAKKKIGDREAAFGLLLHLGIGDTADPSAILVNRFGLDKADADRLVADAANKGWLEKPGGGKPVAGDRVQVNRNNIAEWGTPEVWAQAIRLGHISEADLRTSLENKYKAQGVVDATALKTSIDNDIAQMNADYAPILNPGSAKQDKIRSAHKWDKGLMALVLVAGVGGRPMVEESVDNMDSVDVNELAANFKS